MRAGAAISPDRAGQPVATAANAIPSPLGAAAGAPPRSTLYTVATAHLDTQWLWTIQDTIQNDIPKTLRDNFALFDKYPGYTFNFEGAFRYMLAKEYYPEDYERLKGYVRAGRWHVTGSAVDAGDTNIPNPESLIRHVLYANHFFQREFGATSEDIFLPDCFGFGYALPSAAAHCGLKGFSTQKLTWGSSIGIPFDIGVWQGVDGSGLVAALDPGDYVSKINEDLSRSEKWLERIRKLGQSSGVYAGYKYYGTGDEGGAPDEESVSWVQKSLSGDGPVKVLSAPSDLLYRELTPAQKDRLPHYRGELLMTRHGTGCYTSQAAMKRYNRKNEQLAASAESASVAAAWLGGAAYPREKLTEAWIRFLWHHHHDDVTGTSTPLAYPFSWNDEAISLNAFANVLADAAGAVSRGMDTRAKAGAVPLVVYNALSFEREDPVEASVVFPDGLPKAVRVFGPDGRETPSQITAASERDIRVLFLARAPAMGWSVYEVRPADSVCTMTTGLSAGLNAIENDRYKVRIDANGDVASVRDKKENRELLSAPARIELLRDQPDQWSEWEISYADVMRPPRGFVTAPVHVRILERGPVRASLEIARQADGSTFTQQIRLAAGESAGTVEFDTSVDWQTPRMLVKAAFPLAVSNPTATYDLGLGTIERGNDHEKLYEVPAQKWADITAADGAYGVAVLEDSKYGWDKPSDGVLRLTLIHGPHDIEKDRGRHRFTYALAGHAGDWRSGRIPSLAARLNRPLYAFQAPAHAGALGKRWSMLAVGSEQLAVSALKQAEDSDEIVVRLFENYGLAARAVPLTFASPIVSVREVTGSETPLTAPAGAGPKRWSQRAGTGEMTIDMEPYRPRTFAVRLGPPPTADSSSYSEKARGSLLALPRSKTVPIPFDADVISLPGENPGPGFDGQGHALPGELLPGKVTVEGISFALGPRNSGERNALTCSGQTIELPEGPYTRLYLLAAAAGGDADATFRIDGQSFPLRIQDFTGYVGQSQSLVVGGRIVPASRLEEPFTKTDPIAWTGTHRHGPEGDEPYVFCYLFKYRIDLSAALGSGRHRLTLPVNPAIRILAVSVSDGANDGTRPAVDLVDEVATTRIRPKGGLNIGPVRVSLSASVPGAAIHYTLNGLEPTILDPLYTDSFVVSETTTVRARSFFGTRAADDVAVRTFTFSAPRPAAAPRNPEPGLAWAGYEGEWRNVAPLATAAPVKTGTTGLISLDPRTRDANFGLKFTGYLTVPADGVYTFYTRSDDGSTLSIGDTLVVDNDGLHGAIERSGEIALAAGAHPISVLFFQRGGDLVLDVSYEGPGIERTSLPPGALSHDR